MINREKLTCDLVGRCSAHGGMITILSWTFWLYSREKPSPWDPKLKINQINTHKWIGKWAHFCIYSNLTYFECPFRRFGAPTKVSYYLRTNGTSSFHIILVFILRSIFSICTWVLFSFCRWWEFWMVSFQHTDVSGITSNFPFLGPPYSDPPFYTSSWLKCFSKGAICTYPKL